MEFITFELITSLSVQRNIYMNIERAENTIVMQRMNKYFFSIGINIVRMTSFMLINVNLLVI